MNILLVMDQIDSENNGTTISARRFADALSKRGNDVRFLACGKEADNKFTVHKIHFLPIAEHIVSSQGMALAWPSKKVIKEALEWADVVHFMMPFLLSMRTLSMAEDMGVPHTAAFHVQPENITYSLGLSKSTRAVEFIYAMFRDHFYDRFDHIHCPSAFIAKQLADRNYKAELHVISNGIKDSFQYRKSEKPQEYKDKFVITMIGRLSPEKRQDILISAVSKSKYADKIQLIFAGQGPKKAALMRQGECLKNPPVFKFFDQAGLQEALSYSDLYVHASDVEIEAISCIEAFASGLVPVIANSKLSATPQFAIDERSLFEAGNSEDLASKIDYWLENVKERQDMEIKYAEKGKEYHLENCVAQAEEMFRNAAESTYCYA